MRNLYRNDQTKSRIETPREALQVCILDGEESGNYANYLFMLKDISTVTLEKRTCRQCGCRHTVQGLIQTDVIITQEVNFEIYSP